MDQNILVTVDAVLFGYSKSSGLSILLIKRKIEPFIHQWALPGGFVRDDESLEHAVKRELAEEAGVTIDFLEQLYTFGAPARDPRQRVITCAYFGMVKPEQYVPLASSDAEDVSWFSIMELPALAFDHKNIIEVAIKRVQGKMTYEPIGFELLDDKFPFSDLENLYAAIFNRTFDRRNFRRKVLRTGLVDELEELAPAEGSGRRGQLYRFNKLKYEEMRQQGFIFDAMI